MNRPWGVNVELSPELDLLEQLNGGDMSLTLASKLFPNLERFKRVVQIYVRSGAVRLVKEGDDGERLVQPWELRQLMDDPASWTGEGGRETEYRLGLTHEGYERFAADSQGFFKWLFGR